MSVVPLSEAQLRAQVRAVRDKLPDERIIGIHAPGPWTGPLSIQVDGEDVDVAFCQSSLAVREHLAAREAADRRLVVVTDRIEADLGGDVLARLAKRRLLRIESWRVVMDLFRARALDPRLQRDRWLAEALLEAIPPDGYPPVPNGVLDEDTVWGVLLCTRLGLPDAAPDARTILRWTLEPDRIAAFVTAPVELQNAVAERVASTSGPTGRAILRCILAGSGQDAVPIGLVCRVLAGPGANEEPRLRESAVRLEPALGGHAIESSAALGWADAAEALVREMAASGGVKAAGPLIERGDALLREMRAEDFAHRSLILISGFERRLVRCAGALSSFLAKPAPGDAEGLRDAAQAVVCHSHAAVRPDRVEILQMACRLAQRLRHSTAEPASFAGAAARYAQDGSFADWARTRIWDGDALPAVSDTYRMLSERLAEERARENHRFGALLAEWLALGSSNADVLPVEEILSQVVAPLAQHVRVLLVVVDAMSFAVLHELAGDLASQGWTELGEGDSGTRKVAIAALPSVTEVSRTSLLCGRLRRGTSQDERTGFASQPALVTVSRSGSPPVLFHKADLIDQEGVGLAAAVREEIARPTRQIVGVVINAVDDHLAKGGQLRFAWTVDAIRPLGWLLDAAREANRIVVLTSDHGHVLDRDSVHRRHDTDSLRYRPDDGAPAPDELLIRGPRVLAPWGDRVIVPWSERVRYDVKQNGYHGGATPQEVVVPLAVFRARDTEIPGWSELPGTVPTWWEFPEPITAPIPARIRVASPPLVARPPASPRIPQGDLFTAPAAPPPPAPSSWIDRLLVSSTYASQKQLAARPALDEQRVFRCLLALDERGGKMTRIAFARAVGIPAPRLPGLLAALRRLLNVDGYAVLSVDEVSDSIELNRLLLEKQFELTG